MSDMESEGFAEAQVEFKRQLMAWQEMAEVLKQARYWLAAEVVPVRSVREPLIARIDAALAIVERPFGAGMEREEPKGKP